jgi:ribosomal protein S18 acetylase RimI-like enzyme
MRLPDGYLVRPPRPDEDGPAVVEVWNSDSMAWNGTATSSLDWVCAPWRADGVDLDRDFGVVASASGEIVAYFFLETEPPHDNVFALGGVAASHHGRGLGTAIVVEIERRAAALVDLAPAGSKVTLSMGSLADEPRVGAIFAAHGYVEVRRFLTMEIEFGGPPTPASAPAGVVLQPLEPGQEAAVHTCLTAAFRDHWGGGMDSEDRFLQRHVLGEVFRPELWRLAWQDGRLVGALVGEPVAVQRPDYGYVALIGVPPEERGRGIGEALLRSAFEGFAAIGRRGAFLIVDSESTTGATRLYERVGMRPEPQYATWRKTLRPAANATTDA